MIKSISIISVLASVAFAQSSVTSPSSNPLIPSGISDGCRDFLVAFNSDSTLAPCASALTSVTSKYLPGASAPSADLLNSTLSSLCADTITSNCPESLLRGKIADFSKACNAELTANPNKDVITMYDVLYITLPLRNAVCSKDDSGKYCVTQSKPAPATSRHPTVGPIKPLLVVGHICPRKRRKQPCQLGTSANARRADAPALIPNTTTFRNSNLLFLFFRPDLASADLCVTCARNTLTAYINFESSVPYAPGLSASVLLSNQNTLYTAIQNTCGKSFLSGAVQAAGGLANGKLTGGASRVAGGEVQGLLTVVTVLVSLAVSSFAL
ncbi:hypothetical protein BD779DRAFT_1439641 [Infundibulicybe gibba]|nr:hypothetical protein BD779DRAFT_1439641 [Infundibulicybe gibba]